MEVKTNSGVIISISENNYKLVTEVRKDVVQHIVSYFVHNANKEDPDEFKVKEYDHIYLYDCSHKDDDEWIKTMGLIVQSTHPYRDYSAYTKVRRCEMITAFEAMHAANYRLYYHKTEDGYYHFTWSCKPLSNKQCHHADTAFETFID
jgi:hypothetical protein